MTILLPTTHVAVLGLDVGVFETEDEWVSNVTGENGVWSVEKIVPLGASGGSTHV